MTAPAMVTISRGRAMETEHRVVVAIVGVDGEVVARAGDVDHPFPVRSTIKPLQAIALLETGAGPAHGVSAAELAMACGSHSGEPAHVEMVTGWLRRIGRSESDLRCGAAYADRGAWSGLAPRDLADRRPLRHDCSAKHAGFLTLAAFLGCDPDRYLDVDGPVQAVVLGGLSGRLGVAPRDLLLATDGCGAPTVCVPVPALARALTTLLDGSPTSTAIVDAMTDHPWQVAGTGRFDTRITTALGSNGFTKTGAEGWQVTALREQALVIAAKAMSGDVRASEASMFAVLAGLGAIDAGEFPDLTERVVRNGSGTPVGRIALDGVDELVSMARDRCGS